jgi:hypothetical protein
MSGGLKAASWEGKVKGPQCLIAGVDPCDILNDLKPTSGEVLKVIAIPDTPLDAQGCDAINFEGLDKTVEAFSVLRKWSQRSPSVAGASRIVDALLSADFANPPDFSTESSVTRIVFGVPRFRNSAENLLGAFVANAAAEFKSSTAEFVWRQCAFGFLCTAGLITECFASELLPFKATLPRVVVVSSTMIARLTSGAGTAAAAECSTLFSFCFSCCNTSLKAVLCDADGHISTSIQTTHSCVILGSHWAVFCFCFCTLGLRLGAYCSQVQ